MQTTYTINYQSDDGPACWIVRVISPGRGYALEESEEVCKVQESIDGAIERIQKVSSTIPLEQLTDRPYKVQYLTIYK